MAKQKHADISEKTNAEAQAITKKIQRPGQTKEQSKLIAQGIEKGIDLYKKQQKAKARELDKALKKAKQRPETVTPEAKNAHPTQPRAAQLPWSLLAISWLLFFLVAGVYLIKIAN
ncbi:DUF2956 domain-containing protein [Simiduia curdlanivorans]|uniref:DUF2956 domain-containing protein n=1 Tax=Simiduia curdlanivorans TaxID=1492769 RepID=A0ABV8V7R2_9GAMM|nr:DUF2956 domain-containing protein [Simiduia curdlanivorans]MDN3638650.1 DUF2956 domain-containing protein [Simiduia curdlanivorans]